MKRRTLKPDELKSGRTFYTVMRFASEVGLRYGVTQHIVTSKRQPLPKPGDMVGYRVAPEVAHFIEHHTDAWRTRRDATREAKRRQEIYWSQTR